MSGRFARPARRVALDDALATAPNSGVPLVPRRPAKDADFEESKHPRDKSGQFGSGGGSGKSEIGTTNEISHVLLSRRKLKVPVAAAQLTAELAKKGYKVEFKGDPTKSNLMAWIDGLYEQIPKAAVLSAALNVRSSESAGDAAMQAAGILLTTPDGRALFLKRSAKGDHAGEWCIPGGKVEGDETPLQAAMRELREEAGFEVPQETETEQIDRRLSDDGVDFTTFRAQLPETFEPKIDDEHCGHAWAPLSDPPQPAHPGMAATLKKMAGDAAESGASRENLRETIKYPPEKGPGDERAIDLSMERGGAGSTLKESPAARKFNTTTVDEKATKDEVNYVVGPVREEPCRMCAMFIQPDACRSVAEDISPTGHCDLWEARQAQDADFEESKHPRDEDGKFGSGSGGGGGGGETEKLAPNSKAEVKQASKSLENLSDWISETYGTNPERTAYLDQIADPDLRRLHDVLSDWEPDETDPHFPINRGPLKAITEIDNDWDFESLDYDQDEDLTDELRKIGRRIKKPDEVKADSNPLYRSIENVIGVEDLPEPLEKISRPFLKKVDKFYDELTSDPWMTPDQLKDLQRDVDELLPKALKISDDEIEEAQEQEDFDEDDYLPSEQLVDALRDFKTTLTDTQERVDKQEQMLAEMSTWGDDDVANDAEFNEKDHPRDESGKFGSGGGGHHVSALKSADFRNQEKFDAAFNAIKNDKDLKKADLAKILEDYTEEAKIGKQIPKKTREEILDQIYGAWVRRSRFLNKIGDSIALDRASVREKDQDGRLKVESTAISKANICPYLGREIPGYEEMGLKPDDVYQLLRDPKELAKAAATFNNQPLLSEHVPVFAADYADKAKKVTVGATGGDAVFEPPYLLNSLVVWDGAAIAAIESGEQKQLSCGYHYVADMTPGEYEGQKYDGVMRDIVGNHVALVKEGRAGPDVVVGDTAMKDVRSRADAKVVSDERKNNMKTRPKLTRQGAVAVCALAGYLRPRLAQDATVNLLPIVGSLTAEDFHDRKRDIVRQIKRACSGKLARDESLGEIAEFLDLLRGGTGGGAGGEGAEPNEETDEMPQALEKPVKEIGEKFAEPDVMDADPLSAVEAFLKDKLDPGDLHQVLEMLKGGEGGEDEDPEGEAKLKELGAADDEDGHGPDAPGGEPAQEHRDNQQEWRRKQGATDRQFRGAKDRRQTAADKNLVTRADLEAAIQAATETATKRANEIQEAKAFVQPWVGALSMTFDSAPDVYRKALKMMGVRNAEKIQDPYALRIILEGQTKPGDRRAAASSRAASQQAADSAVTQRSFAERFPDAARIRLT